MSKDSCHTYIHLHASHHADLFEEFCHPPSIRSSTNQSSSTHTNPTNPPTTTTSDPADPDLTHIPGHFLPFESIHLPQHLMPVNPEDEDGVVPDMHAAFGILRARAAEQGVGQSGLGERSGRGVLGSARVEEVWSDLGVERLVDGVEGMNVNGAGGEMNGGIGTRVGSGGNMNGVRREGRRGGILSVR